MIEILRALNEAIVSGKIRYYGISNYSAEQLKDLLLTADANNLPRPVICQPPLSILKPDALNDIVPLCAEEEIMVCPYQILQGGLLTGKYKRGMPLPENSRKSEKDNWVWELNDALFDKLERIELQARKQSVIMTKYAIQWILEQASVVSAIVGVKNKRQIDIAAG
jgi:aryl-alcohol dehydrogenase-like predicted oxidoreductase